MLIQTTATQCKEPRHNRIVQEQFAFLLNNCVKQFLALLLPLAAEALLLPLAPDGLSAHTEQRAQYYHWQRAEGVLHIMMFMWLETRYPGNDGSAAKVPSFFVIRAVHLLVQRLHLFCREPDDHRLPDDLQRLVKSVKRGYLEKTSSQRPGPWCASGHHCRVGLYPSYGDRLGTLLYFFIADGLHNMLKSAFTDNNCHLRRVWLLWIRPWRGANKKGKFEDDGNDFPHRKNYKFVASHRLAYTSLFRLHLKGAGAAAPSHIQSLDDNTDNKWTDYLGILHETMETFANNTLLDWLYSAEVEERQTKHNLCQHTGTQRPAHWLFDDPNLPQSDGNAHRVAKEIREDLDATAGKLEAFKASLEQLQNQRNKNQGAFGRLDAWIGGNTAPASKIDVAKLMKKLEDVRHATAAFEEYYGKRSAAFKALHAGSVPTYADDTGSIDDTALMVKERKLKIYRQLWTYPLRSYESETLVKVMYRLSSRINDLIEVRPWKLETSDDAESFLEHRPIAPVVAGRQHHFFAVYIEDGRYYLKVKLPDDAGDDVVAIQGSPSEGYTLDNIDKFKDIYEMLRYYSEVPLPFYSAVCDNLLSKEDLRAQDWRKMIAPVNLRFLANRDLLISWIMIFPILWTLCYYFPAVCAFIAVCAVFAYSQLSLDAHDD